MSTNSEEVQRLVAEKRQLEKEETILKTIIEQVKRQLSALQVRHIRFDVSKLN